MNAFINDNQSWTEICDEELIKLYVDDARPVLEISNIMSRSPGSIISRLMKLKVIATRQSARGYQAYKDSALYQEAIERQKALKTEKKKKPSKLLNKYNSLVKKYQDVKDRYNDLDEDYEELEQEFDVLEQDYEELENDYIDLEDSYDELVRELRAKDQIIKQLINYLTKND